MQESPAILTFSHLRWNFVHQRPQHILSRLARRHRVVFVEEPILDHSEAPRWQFEKPAPNVVVCRPHTPCEAPGFDDRQLPYLRQLLPELIERQNLADYLVWFYTPLPIVLTRQLRPQAVIYDCMDELAAFLGAPPELFLREEELLAKADLVFTGGPSLYRAKKDRHPRVYCFPSSVDAQHFASAHNGLEEAPDQVSLPHPRLGYYGVIDERLDLNLLESVATAHPEWQIVVVGPVVKIDPFTLPRNPNIHYFGQRPYAQLPAYLRGWDVCLMPFARNRSTQFISPTKTLEYMAAGKTIVSTPITDVAEPYADIVYLGGTTEEFIAGCEKAVSVGREERNARVRSMREVLSRTSWDATAAAMQKLIEI